MSRFEVVLNPFQFETFYHGTTDTNAESIKKVGLKVSNPAEDYELIDEEEGHVEPGHPPGVYLAESFRHASEHGSAVFEVRLPDRVANSEIWKDGYGWSQDERFPHDIPSTLLRQVQ
jgi:hypothetical protein